MTAAADAPSFNATADVAPAREPAYRLFGLALLTLFLELALIRFAAAQVLYLAYFGNFVLVSAFLGIGVGFLLERRSFSLVRLVAPTLVAFIAFIVYARVDASLFRATRGQVFFGHAESTSTVPPWLALPLLFIAIAFLFASLAQETARAFAGRAPLTAYSIDVAGSMAGIASFTLLSWAGMPPTVWLAIACALLAALVRGRDRLVAAVAGVLVVGMVQSSAPNHYTRWSPYQRVEVWPMAESGEMKNWYHLAVNGIGHQTMQPVGTKEGIYDFPYKAIAPVRGKPFRKVLIIGAGSGTDVSYALANGATHIDAVEIDPEIRLAGKIHHPAHPYDDPRVTVIIDDGRSFLQRAKKGYDLVIFALPDSLASLSSLSNVRLESFLFTLESMKQATRVVADDGVVVLYNYYRRTWLLGRLSDMLEEACGHPPVGVQLDEDGGLLAAIACGKTVGGKPRPGERLPFATDDWPFLYVERPHLPPLYMATMAMIVACALLAVGATGNLRGATIWKFGPFTLMGAAFLLLETKSVVQFSLLFGATWLVNSMVFFAILASVLAANLVTARLPGKSPLVPFFLLVVALAAGVLVEPGSLLAIASPGLRYAAASALWFAPIFFANLAFARLFRDTAHGAAAFGMNVVGTALGGALEYLSLAVGYQILAVVVTALYVVAALWALALSRAEPADGATS